MTDHSHVKLGRKPARRDARTLQLRRYLRAGARLGAALQPKPAMDWLAAVPSFPMYGNDVHGDCAIAAIGHMVQVWTGNQKTGVRCQVPGAGEKSGVRCQVPGARGKTGVRCQGLGVRGKSGVRCQGLGARETTGAREKHAASEEAGAAEHGTTPAEDDILRVYQILSPDDDGCVLLDVLNYWRKNPICGVQLGAYAAVNPQDQDEAEVALEIFGGLYAGAQLPLAAQTQDVWGVAPAPSPQSPVPGSWGGHCIPFGKYDAQRVSCVTWGAVKDATWPWLQEYVDELYALISPDWPNGAGVTPEGLDMAALRSDLEQVSGAG